MEGEAGRQPQPGNHSVQSPRREVDEGQEGYRAGRAEAGPQLGPSVHMQDSTRGLRQVGTQSMVYLVISH